MNKLGIVLAAYLLFLCIGMVNTQYHGGSMVSLEMREVLDYISFADKQMEEIQRMDQEYNVASQRAKKGDESDSFVISLASEHSIKAKEILGTVEKRQPPAKLVNYQALLIDLLKTRIDIAALAGQAVTENDSEQIRQRDKAIRAYVKKTDAIIEAKNRLIK